MQMLKYEIINKYVFKLIRLVSEMNWTLCIQEIGIKLICRVFNKVPFFKENKLYYELLFIVCLWISIKFNHMFGIPLWYLLGYIFEAKFQVGDVLEMEMDVLRLINYRII
jgi:hypothetical protein